MTTIAKNKNVGEFLETEGINCKIQTDRKEDLKILMDKMDVLIEKAGHEKEKPGGGKGKASKKAHSNHFRLPARVLIRSWIKFFRVMGSSGKSI